MCVNEIITILTIITVYELFRLLGKKFLLKITTAHQSLKLLCAATACAGWRPTRRTSQPRVHTLDPATKYYTQMYVPTSTTRPRVPTRVHCTWCNVFTSSIVACLYIPRYSRTRVRIRVRTRHLGTDNSCYAWQVIVFRTARAKPGGRSSVRFRSSQSQSELVRHQSDFVQVHARRVPLRATVLVSEVRPVLGVMERGPSVGLCEHTLCHEQR
jgi:hypothetical protein